ncbi:DUF4422 domain-containing protein [Pedobacter punctiformis]|uniref:DUF4422 domain-containing protein n=1 Tax=Pedobacter punctiformis TaxID=3004097 RepID=A0ABT4L6D3_9SPHI|nr:DUF4422 domain-containing protein [Pedobacter sp. HCMS5-2]MCZ4243488.1 DUF4422 domain-containing protein [Pedobacter sp. HCMS5-2]
MSQDLTIFSVFHKEYPVPQCDFIKPIQVGRKSSTLELGFTSDDEGDNIADKNDTHSELTALYWIWKNMDKIDSNWIGLCHYRRYFILPEIHIKKKLLQTKTVVDSRDVYPKELNHGTLNQVCSNELKTVLIEALKEGNVIIPIPSSTSIELIYNASIKNHYVYYHIKEDWYLMRDAVIKFYPDLKDKFDTFFDSETKMHNYNMFIADKNTFRSYCEWLFPIIFELEKKIKISEYPYQKRVFGFLSERLINLYLSYNNIKTKALPVVFFT